MESIPANETFAQASLRYIKDDINDLKTRYIKLGFHLDEMVRCNYFKEIPYIDENGQLIEGMNYSTIFELCKNYFGLDKGRVSELINVYKRFGFKNDIAPKYEKYNYTQLTEMLPLKSNEIGKIKPDMTCKQIRDYKAELNPKKAVRSTEQNSVATSQQIIVAAPDETKEINNENCNPGRVQVLPVLKNNDKRIEWIKNYKEWGVWYIDHNINARYYRFNFPDESYIIAVEYKSKVFRFKPQDETEEFSTAHFHLVKKDCFYSPYDCSQTEIIEYLKNMNMELWKKANSDSVKTK